MFNEEQIQLGLSDNYLCIVLTYLIVTKQPKILLQLYNYYNYIITTHSRF